MTERLQSQKPKRLSRQFVVIGFAVIFMLLQFSVLLHASSPDYQLVRLRFKNQSQLQTWVDNGLDVWEVDGNTALVSLAKEQRSVLRAESLDLEFVAGLANASFPACYRTYDDMLSFFQARAVRYPQLFQLFDVGDSWEKQSGRANRDVYVVRVSSPRGPAVKPKLFVVAEHHAREIITPEVAMNFVDDLLENYGQDATITWLLDHREVWVMPMANPDGHAHAAQMESWRKNTRRTDACAGGSPPNSYGVDLNRNYGYQWGEEAGSSPNPCFLTYRGESPFSEPETQAVRDLVRDKDFDILVSLHSYGGLVLYPWAFTSHPAPDAADLSALAGRMASPAGYTAIQATGIGYISSGDTTDWSYGELGIPSFTIEVGGGSFWPACNVKGQLYEEVRPALIYAAMAADRPYQVAGGPEALQVAIDVGESQVVARAKVSDQWTGDDAIESAELFVEAVGTPGTGIVLSPSDGECNGQYEWMAASLPDAVLARYAGRRVPLFIVAQDVTGRRGVPAVVWLDLRDYAAPQAYSVKLWPAGGAKPAFEIDDGYVYQGTEDAGHILLTVRDGRVYRGAGTLGEVLYTLSAGQVRAGEAGPVVYTVRGSEIYQGQGVTGTPIYLIENKRLVEVGTSGDIVVWTANVDLVNQEDENIALILPILADKLY
ncbi:MAG: M14 family metallopeptidase [Anaerolineae bacterium]